jgi:hypothetical protein
MRTRAEDISIWFKSRCSRWSQVSSRRICRMCVLRMMTLGRWYNQRWCQSRSKRKIRFGLSEKGKRAADLARAFTLHMLQAPRLVTIPYTRTSIYNAAFPSYTVGYWSIKPLVTCQRLASSSASSWHWQRTSISREEEWTCENLLRTCKNKANTFYRSLSLSPESPYDKTAFSTLAAFRL